MWANILFALLTLLPVAGLPSCLLPRWIGINLWLSSFIFISFCLSRFFRFSFLYTFSCVFFFVCALSPSAVRVAVTRIWIIRQMCQVEMLKFPTTLPNSLPPCPSALCLPICLAEVGKRYAVSGLAELKSRLPNDCKWMAANDCECYPRAWPIWLLPAPCSCSPTPPQLFPASSRLA